MKLRNTQVCFRFIMLMILILLTAANDSVGHNENQNRSNSIRRQYPKARFLEQTGQPIRITTDLSAIRHTLDETQIKYLNKLIQTATNFFAKLIKIKPLQINKYTDPGENCVEKQIIVPQQDKVNGVLNSDLHIYFNAMNISNVLAQTQFCYKEKSQSKRSTFGMIRINIYRFFQDSGIDIPQNTFQYHLQILIHEILHLLGFMDIQQYNNNKIDQASQAKKDTAVLSSKNVLQTAKQYYHSLQVKGMPLSPGEAHWSIGTFLDEIMMRYPMDHLGAIKLSIFTIALLKDTKYYEDVNENFVYPMHWGKRTGEFLPNYPIIIKGLDFYNKIDSLSCTPSGHISEKQFLKFKDNNTNITRPQSCSTYLRYFHTEQESDFFLYGKKFNSKCFVSNLTNPKLKNPKGEHPKIRCHQYECSANHKQITIIFEQLENLKFVCSSKQKGKAFNISYNNQSLGTLTCPSSYSQFCLTPFCKNGCSENGFCLVGKCYCNAGYSSEDCSKKCDLTENNKCVESCSQNLYANPDNTCKDTCPNSYFKSEGKCLPCDFSCSKCTGPSSSECTACQFVTYLQNGQCVSSCGKGKIKDKKKKTCEICPIIGCEKCLHKNSCRKCLPGYERINFKCFLKQK